MAKVSPIYKEGDKKKGVIIDRSVLSIVAKLFEKLACIQLTDYLNANDILSQCHVRLPSEPLINVVLVVK
jgi:hypothetical protein